MKPKCDKTHESTGTIRKPNKRKIAGNPVSKDGSIFGKKRTKRPTGGK